MTEQERQAAWKGDGGAAVVTLLQEATQVHVHPMTGVVLVKLTREDTSGSVVSLQIEVSLEEALALSSSLLFAACDAATLMERAGGGRWDARMPPA